MSGRRTARQRRRAPAVRGVLVRYRPVGTCRRSSTRWVPAEAIFDVMQATEVLVFASRLLRLVQLAEAVDPGPITAAAAGEQW